jgi:hypothetical protein
MAMAHIIIKDVGPVNEVEFDLNKVNIIIGPQSSGKSTIDKIACYFFWVEKRVSQDQSFAFFQKDDNFIKELVRFHKIEGYLKPSSYISYKSEVISVEYRHAQKLLSIEWVDQYKFQNSKIAYIPAERNIVAAIPNWFEVKLFDNNTLNYMKDWGESRQIHTKDVPFQIPGIKAAYYYEGGNDYVITDDNGILLLTNTSSGYQSIIPLNVLLHYLTTWIYNNDAPTSIEKNDQINLMNSILYEKTVWGRANIDRSDKKKIQDFLKEFNEADTSSKWRDLHDTWKNTWEKFNKYGYSRLFIEEPEQNLFPSTQMALIYHLFESLNNTDKDHKLFITTHSQYVLYAINNCILGGLIHDNIPADILSDISFRNSFVNPKDVSVWEIKDGKFNTYEGCERIQDEDGLIRRNYFDCIMNELMDDFNSLLNYYESDNE